MKEYTRFLLSLIKIGCIGFGGGSALIPIIEKEVIDKQKLDTKENLDKDVIVASITPGALPVEIAASIGKRNFGGKGMVMGAVCMALPGTLLTVLMLTLLSVVKSQMLSFIELVSVGVSVFIIYLLLSYIAGMLRECRKESREREYKAIFLMVAVFLMVCEKNIYKLFELDRTPILSVSTLQVLTLAFFCIFYSRGKYSAKHVIIMAVLGCMYLLSHGKSKVIENEMIVYLINSLMIVLSAWGIWDNIKKENWKYVKNGKAICNDILLWLMILILCSLPAVLANKAVIQFIWKGCISAIMSFGGGDAYLTIADGLFVESGMISEEQYYGQIVSVVNVLPGSILCKTLSGVGYCIGWNLTENTMVGLLFAATGFICSIAASCLFFMMAYHLYDNLVLLQPFRMVSRWIRPIIAGFLFNIILALCNQSMIIMENLSVTRMVTGIGLLFLLIIDILLVQKKKIGLFRILMLNIGIVLASVALM